MSNDLFIQATRQGLRFNTPIGDLSVEDLWELDRTTTRKNAISIISIATDVKAELREATTEVDPFDDGEQQLTETPKIKKLNLQLQILKFISETKIAEAQAKASGLALAQAQKRLQDAIAKKEAEGLDSMSIDEMRAELAKLTQA